MILTNALLILNLLVTFVSIIALCDEHQLDIPRHMIVMTEFLIVLGLVIFLSTRTDRS